MTHKARILAAIAGRRTDRLPFAGRIELWYNYHRAEGSLPDRWQGMSQWDIQRALDIGLVGYYGAGPDLYSMQHESMQVRRTENENGHRLQVQTPQGTITAAWEYPAELRGSASITIQTEHLFKAPDDYPAVQHYLEHTHPVENYQEYVRLPRRIGEDGVALPWTGKVPIHSLMEDVMGYEQFYYEWHDNRDRVEALHEALCEQQLELMRVAAGAPCESIEVGANYDEQMTPPPIFQSHIVPFYRQACNILHDAGKLVAVHGDGEMKRILQLLADTDVDVVEAITPQPMTSIDMEHLRDLWAHGPAIWGGLPAVIFTPSFSETEFRRHVENLLASMAGHDRFILGFGDNVPTDALFERVEWVAERVNSG